MEISKNLSSKIPKNVSCVTDTLEKTGFEAYLVGGCVRDILMDIEPKDWDVTTKAKPEEIISLFEKTVYENNFGTVGVCVPVKTSSFNQRAGLIGKSVSRVTLNEDVSRETLKEGVSRETSEYMILH